MSDESKVQSRLISELKSIGALPLRITNITGCPDVVACVGGVFVGFECKDDNEGAYGQTKVQSVYERKITRAGGRYFLVDKHNIGDVILYVKHEFLD